MGLTMLDYLIDDNYIDIDKNDINLIKNIILYLYKFIILPLYSGSDIYISQNLDKIGFNSLYLSSTIIKNRVLWLNNSMHLRSADWASIVNLSALYNTILLNILPLLKLIFVFALILEMK